MSKVRGLGEANQGNRSATIPLFKVRMSAGVGRSVEEVLYSGYIGQGRRVEDFEAALSNYLGAPHCCTVNSCTSAIHLALHLVKALGFPDRDEVLTTPLTCTATNLPILANGLRPRWVDVDPSTCNISADDLMRKVGPRTLAILAVHWGGSPCDLSEIRRVQEYCAEAFGFTPPVIEDCAHAFGAEYKGRRLSNHGNWCTFSFQAIKHLTTGDGGLLVLPDEDLHRKAKLLRWYGLDREQPGDLRIGQNITDWGYKFHMNDINATIGLLNLQGVDPALSVHRDNAAFFDRALQGVDGIKFQRITGDGVSSSWVYTIFVERRDEFVRRMTENGIQVSRVHERNDHNECFAAFREPLPNVDQVSSNMICIPCGWWVSHDDREYIVDTISRGW
jgi:dTDP-4-amino-4,6-dideoxygalactose transaminase